MAVLSNNSHNMITYEGVHSKTQCNYMYYTSFSESEDKGHKLLLFSSLSLQFWNLGSIDIIDNHNYLEPWFN